MSKLLCHNVFISCLLVHLRIYTFYTCMSETEFTLMRYCPKCREELMPGVIDQKERLRCPNISCGFIFWNNPVPVVAIVVETRQGVILAHNKLAPKGVFSIMTGFLEADESPESAARRETLEELGLIGRATTFLGVYSFKRANQIILAYHIIADGEIQLNEELDEFIIVGKEKLAGWNETGKFEIEEWLNKLKVLA